MYLSWEIIQDHPTAVIYVFAESSEKFQVKDRFNLLNERQKGQAQSIIFTELFFKPWA